MKMYALMIAATSTTNPRTLLFTAADDEAVEKAVVDWTERNLRQPGPWLIEVFRYRVGGYDAVTGKFKSSLGRLVLRSEYYPPRVPPAPRTHRIGKFGVVYDDKPHGFPAAGAACDGDNPA